MVIQDKLLFEIRVYKRSRDNKSRSNRFSNRFSHLLPHISNGIDTFNRFSIICFDLDLLCLNRIYYGSLLMNWAKICHSRHLRWFLTFDWYSAHLNTKTTLIYDVDRVTGFCIFQYILVFWCILYQPKVVSCLTLVLLNSDIPCLCKQCRSRSVGFWRSQLIWICTVCH